MLDGDAAFWTLDPEIDFLNHGSFGATPRPVQEAQAAWRRRLEAEPVRFFQRDLEGELDRARHRLAGFIGARDEDLALVPNATAGVNAVLRSYDFSPGDEIVVSDHVYNACRNVADYVAARSGARIVTATIPFPVASPHEVIEGFRAALTHRTRLAMIEHVASPTAVIFPVAEITVELSARGIDVLVDGAHAPGMVTVDVDAIGAAFYTGNCHKWMCAPKGAGFLHVRSDLADGVVPAVVSHGYNTSHEERSRLHLLFDWTGTHDPTTYLSIPDAIDAMAGLGPGGWPGLMDANRDLALTARSLLCEALEIEAPAPDSMIGSMASVPLPDTAEELLEYGRDPLQDRLLFDHNIEVPIQSWVAWPKRLLRISAQAYNSIEQYERLSDALSTELR